MEDVAVSVASKVAEGLVARVVRACSYVIFYASYLRELEDEVANLDRARQRVQHSVVEAQNSMKQIEADVEKWATDAKSVADKASDIQERNEKAKKTCFYGWFPIPKARYDVVKEARETVKAIQELIPKGQFNKVYCENAPPGLVPDARNVNSLAGDRGAPDTNSLAGDGGDTITESRASIFQGIMKALDDEKHRVIGVYGPGGVGKTTLLEEVEKKLRKEGKPFRMIVKAKVSRTPDLKKIQYDIAYALSLNILKDEPSEEGRRDLLFKRLQKDPSEKVLIILDDLWAELDLKAVGIPLGDESMKCKLLLTSRDKSVLEQKMHADQTFRLEGLNDVEAFRLFEMTVGDKLKDGELKQIADEVVKKLAGLPLLINSVASTLKYSGQAAWRISSKKIDDSNTDIIVKLSYDHLNSEDTKSLFLLCGLIGGTIQVETLLVLGMGLGLFEEFNDTIQDLRDRLNIALIELRSACLLLDGNDEDNVTIHDLYSEVVVSNAFSGQHSLMINSNYGSWPKEKLEKCWACLVNVGNDKLAELMLCRFPHVKILMLSEQYEMGDCSRMDFTHMKELRALCLCSMSITSLPSSMEILANLRSLSIHCYVEDVAILGKLNALRILSFAGSRISRLPKEIGELTNLQSLNLSNCYSLQIIEPGALKRLINLEELHMKGSFDKWMGGHEIPLESCGASLAELKSLTKLTSLEIAIPHPIILLEDGDLPFGNLVRFWIDIGNAKRTRFKVLRTMELKLEGCDNILSREWVQKALQKTQCLNLCKLSEFKKSAHELCTQGFRELKHLDIDDSPSIKYIANSSDGLPLTAFVKLESLFLKNLINLEKIYHGTIAPECSSKLKAVKVEQCGRLKYLWRLSDMQRFVRLEEIEVRDCDSMQSIITHNAGEEIVSADNRVVLPKVRRLVLGKLPNMTSFCARAEMTSEDTPIQVSFPLLESLKMVGLLDLEKILYGQPPLEYSNLKSIEIRESRSKSSFFKSDWILKMPNLESLEIESSPSAEAVFDLGELKVTRDVKILTWLMEMTIRELPNLRCMWKHDVKLQGISVFRSLKKLVVIKTGLAFLFPVSVAKCLRELRDIDVKDCPNMKAVIVDEEGRDEGTNDVIEFPLLKSLLIRNCPMEKFFSYPHGNKEPVTATSDSQDGYSDSFFDQKVSLPSLESLWLELVGSFKRIWHGDLPESSFCELATLTLINCSELVNVFPSTIIGRLHNLNSVEIANCPSLDSLFDCGSLDANTEQTTVLLPKLEQVRVTKAGKMRSLVKSDSQMIWGFPSLKIVSVTNCSDMKYLFPNFTATTLEKLERIDIRQCEQLKEVVPEEEGGQSKVDVMSFPSLRHLSILQCPNFGAFIQSPTSVKRQLGKTAEENDEFPQPFFNEMVTFPNIRSLEIEGLQCTELWNIQIPADSFWTLESLELKGCHNLQRIARPTCGRGCSVVSRSYE
ncbi:disease resistance protein At4g27190-like isoform X2 [Syzygium oleosum]|uniref:disease resistance protein At4g27190-like isoform X2 n=1 Tax=Syzygium oleosum TaxID=219896 RepID=UPI0024BAB924|nr:disease resistance protein At4g27190-like isoform X2 [Syzygium oleosum]